ncbi:MAG: hypothetical protein IKY93_00535 [Alistipes sp.]|nr:hypothetical protein [Alistipes sp.]
MKRFLLTVMAVAGVLSASAQLTPNKIVVPNIPGYQTLKGDFHIHTVFTDATVWPATRVQEAIWEGLDVIAITEHIDTRHQKYVNQGVFTEKCDRNFSYEIAKKAAGKNILIVHGGEISRGMPPGHFNCLFVKDNEALCAAAESQDKETNNNNVVAMKNGLAEARNQGAFIMWNHPNWCKQAPNETKMWKEHKDILKDGKMDAIEIYNMACGYTPEGHKWALENNLAMLGNSDCHAPFFMEVDYLHGAHRPVTLVFAKEKSLNGVREALDARRSAVFAEGNVYGREQEVLPLLEACLKVKKTQFKEKEIIVEFENVSSIPVVLSKGKGSEDTWYARHVVIPPFTTFTYKVRPLLEGDSQPAYNKSLKKYEVNFVAENFYVGPNKPAKFSVKVSR